MTEPQPTYHLDHDSRDGEPAIVRPLRPVAVATDRRQNSQSGHRVVWMADELMAHEFPEPRWAVPGLIAEGLTLLAGPPKAAKSWLAYGLSLDIATGGRALDKTPVEAGPVLYVALEDGTGRRLQERLGILLAGRSAPRDLTIITEIPVMPRGGEIIAEWLTAHPTARLVVIDTLAKIRGTQAANSQQYDADYAAIGAIKRLADHFQVAVLVVHHVRKMAADDFLATVSGTNGIAGAADAILVLERPRGEETGVLHVTGRDIEEADHAMQWHPTTGRWRQLDGPAEQHATGSRGAILRHLREYPDSTPTDIASRTDIAVGTVKTTCSRLHKDGHVRKDAAGRYRLPCEPTDGPGP